MKALRMVLLGCGVCVAVLLWSLFVLHYLGVPQP